MILPFSYIISYRSPISNPDLMSFLFEIFICGRKTPPREHGTNLSYTFILSPFLVLKWNEIRGLGIKEQSGDAVFEYQKYNFLFDYKQSLTLDQMPRPGHYLLNASLGSRFQVSLNFFVSSTADLSTILSNSFSKDLTFFSVNVFLANSLRLKYSESVSSNISTL